MDPQIKKRLIFPIQQYPAIAKDGWGNTTFGPPIDRMGYVEGKITTVRNLDGEEVVTTLKIYLDGIIELTRGDEFSHQGTRRVLQAYQQYPGLRTGTGTTVVYV